MSGLSRRVLLASLAAAALQGCAQQRAELRDQIVSQSKNACGRLPTDYPTPHELVADFKPSLLAREAADFTMDNYFHGIRGAENVRAYLKKYIETSIENNIRSLSGDKAIQPDTRPKIEFVTREMLKADILKSPWIITIESLALPFGYKHLSVTLGSEHLQSLYIRTEGVAATPKRYDTPIKPPSCVVKIGDTTITSTSRAPVKYFALNEKDLSLFGNDTLFGLIGNQPLPKPKDREIVASFAIDYPTAVNFISRLSQFVVAFDSTATPYELWKTNSNSFAYSVLKHGLGEHFPEKEIRDILSTSGLKVPGYGKDVLPEFQANPAFQMQHGETTQNVIGRILRSPPATDKCQGDAQTDLALTQLMFMADLFEPASALSTALVHQTSARRSMPFGVTVVGQKNSVISGSTAILTSPHP